MAVGGLKKKRRKQIVVISMICLLGVLTILWFLPKNAFQYFMSPSELVENPPSQDRLIKIGGLVEEGTLVRGQGKTITFNVTDGGTTVAVKYTGILPDLFKEGQGMIASGKYVNNTFEATEILAKHDENYMPKEVADALKAQGVFKPANGD